MRAEGDAGDSQADVAPALAKQASSRACGGPDRPCTWGEVSDATKSRIQAVADLALRTLYDGKTPAQVADALRAEADVSVLSATDEMIRYHVKGGRPAWVWLESSKRTPTIGVPAPFPVTLALDPPAAADARPPAGAQHEGEKPRKKALILSPFRWQWQLSTKWARRFGADEDERTAVYDDETERLQAQFASVPDYEGGVTRKENRLSGDTIDFGVSVADFSTWRDYDVIHVSTHGTACAQGASDCEPALATGELLWVSDDREHYNRAGVDVGFIPYGKAKTEIDMARALTPNLEFKSGQAEGEDQAMDGVTHYAAGPFALVTTTWFEETYKGKLADKIIFLSACSSGAKEQSLPKALAGPATAVIGWDRPMTLHTATYGAGIFWARALGYPHQDILTPNAGGSTVEEAFAKLDAGIGEATFTKGPLKSVVIEGVLSSDDVTGAKLSPEGDGKTRAREIIRLVQGKKKLPLADGALVELVGAPGDGEPDTLKLEAELIGVAADDDPAQYVIGVDVNGHAAAKTWRPAEEVEPGKWRGEATVELDFDLAPDATFSLEPWVDLPGGGRSRWRYEDLGVEYFVITISGPRLDNQTFTIEPGRAKFSGMGTEENGGLLLMFQDRGARTSVSADGSVLNSLIGGAQGPGVATGTISFGSKTDGGSWSVIVWVQAEDCPPNFVGCKNINLRVDTGSMKVSRFALGEGLVRPNATGPTLMTATFEAKAHVSNDGPEEGDVYTMKGAFSLAE